MDQERENNLSYRSRGRVTKRVRAERSNTLSEVNLVYLIEAEAKGKVVVREVEKASVSRRSFGNKMNLSSSDLFPTTS